MSDKKRRDITLGEMQDECKKHNGGKFATNDICLARECTMYNVCTFGTGGMTPANINLTDPPRFNEAQMAALKQSYDSGVTKIKKTESAIHYTIPDLGAEIVITNHSITSSMEVGETLDLAELLGKDGAE